MTAGTENQTGTQRSGSGLEGTGRGADEECLAGRCEGSGLCEDALEACKRYMRVDGEDEDGVILALMEAARAYLARAGIAPERSCAGQYDLALWGLTLYYYDHRDAVGNEAAFPIGLRPVINQMKAMRGVPPSVSGSAADSSPTRGEP